jgi:glycosyltransferase involved in cell wall biosynthesis
MERAFKVVMNKPFISCICITYCRVTLLQEMLASFLAQEYSGQKEFIIFNTFDQQELVFEHPQVKVINSKTRPATLGATRNAAVAHASGEWVVLADDDDKILSNHLENSVCGVNLSEHDWSWQSHQYYMEGEIIKSLTSGTFNVVAYSKKAWAELGGFPELNCGEDRSFVGNLTKKFKGVKIALSSGEASYIYSWGNSAFHISGEGDRGNATAMERTERFANEQVKLGREPKGRIVLQPKMLLDYPAIVKRFNGAVSKLSDDRIGKVGICLLGRYGDILNILPVCKFIADKWGNPLFFVAREFASTLDGVSYVIPQPLDLAYDMINAAVLVANQKCELVISGQVWGQNYITTRESPVYNTESWRVAGFLEHFHDTQNFPLVIDRRDEGREQKLSDRVLGHLPVKIDSVRPIILVNVCGGHTAPFSASAHFLKAIKDQWGEECHVIDLSPVRAERIYDLLGLYDRACLLITNDTATLHLAAASDIQVVALVNDIPWLSSVTRCNVVLRLKYAEAMPNIGKVHDAIRELIGVGCL